MPVGILIRYRQQMCRRILVLCCIFIVTITQPGCIGLFVNGTAECKNETPYTGVHDIFNTKPPPQNGSAKAEFLKDWGKPYEIIATSENEETWIYNQKCPNVT